MEWETYYERFYDWADSTQISRISSLTSFGPSEEIAEVVQNIWDEAAASRLVKKAVAAGVRFKAEEIMDIVEFLDHVAIEQIVNGAVTTFTADQLEELSSWVDYDVLERAAKRSRVSLDDENVEMPIAEVKAPKLGFWAALGAFVGAASNSGHSHKDNGRCNGDCANCPPHYGYRYGRWYYGRCHTRGCTRGGNIGNGRYD